jgi:hypothetical protein
MLPLRKPKSPRSTKAFKFFKKYHKWLSIVLGLFIVLFSLSGIVLNHRGVFSSVDVNRAYLPEVYRYNNWNLAAVKGAIDLPGDSSLIYGNIGTWLTRDNYKTFTDFNAGFPEGIDNRKVSCVLQTSDGQLFSGTYFGLFEYDFTSATWVNLPLPVHKQRVVDLIEVEGSLFVMTRSFLLKKSLAETDNEFEKIVLPPPEGYNNKTGLFKTLWIIHSGEILGVAGKLFVDIIGILFIFLTITGLIYFLFPNWIKKRKKNARAVKNMVWLNRFSLRWHNKIGWWLGVFLIITTLTGMFLRPPLLIPIASVQVPKIPWSILDDDNAWYDQFRAFVFDKEKDAFIIGTTNGFYFAEPDFKNELVPIGNYPPVSVMGINVFEPTGMGNYLVGSFSGLFHWSAKTGYIEDVLNKKPYMASPRGGSPFGANTVTGFLYDYDELPYYFDYAHGARPVLHNLPFTKMPQNIIDASPISLWNLALEIHTARIYGVLIGDFYILLIPLFGLIVLFILISGLFMYLKVYKK